VYTNPEALAIYAMVVGALMASRVILENARRRAEAQAAELAAARPAVERLAAIVEQSQDAIASLTVNGVITSWNKGAERLFGYSAAEAIGRQAVDLFSAGDARTQLEAQWGPFIQARVSRGEAFEMDQERPRKDGTTIQMRVSVSPLFDDQGRVAGASVIWHDISDRVALERRQRELNEELERRVRERTAELERTAGELRAVNAELESFSYSVSHDLRSPLRGIDGFSQALIEDYGDQLPEQGRRYLGLVRKGTLEMSQLIDDLLRLAQASRADLRAERVDLSGLAGEVVATLRGLDASRAVDIQIESGLVVEGDALLLRTVMDNLLANAWKFTRTRPRGRIEFRKVMGDPTPAYVVRDNGVGFDPAFAHKLFRPFQRLHAASEFEGTAVGLATVRRIVERHGGRVWAEATTDGSSFYFTIADRLGGAS
jgi:PAS domain S-box-containing protein